jgi:hypothetical protein
MSNYPHFKITPNKSSNKLENCIKNTKTLTKETSDVCNTNNCSTVEPELNNWDQFATKNRGFPNEYPNRGPVAFQEWL